MSTNLIPVVLVLKARPQYVDDLLSALDLVAKGAEYTNLLGGWLGPVTITDPRSERLVMAVLEEEEGHDETDFKEPYIQQDRAILAGARALVSAALGWPDEPDSIRTHLEAEHEECIRKIESKLYTSVPETAPEEVEA